MLHCRQPAAARPCVSTAQTIASYDSLSAPPLRVIDDESFSTIDELACETNKTGASSDWQRVGRTVHVHAMAVGDVLLVDLTGIRAREQIGAAPENERGRLNLRQTRQERPIAIGAAGASSVRLRIPLTSGDVFGCERLGPGWL